MKTLDVLTYVLLVIGGLIWGLVGFFDINPITMIFGAGSFLGRLIYALVGLGALYELLTLRAIQRRWHIGRHEVLT